MDYRVKKTDDGRVLVVAKGFRASYSPEFANGWIFDNVFPLNEKLTEVVDAAEAEELYGKALACYNESKNSKARAAQNFYRAMYSGVDPDPDDFGLSADNSNFGTSSDDEDDDKQPPLDPAKVPKRPSQPSGGATIASNPIEEEMDLL